MRRPRLLAEAVRHCREHVPIPTHVDVLVVQPRIQITCGARIEALAPVEGVVTQRTAMIAQGRTRLGDGEEDVTVWLRAVVANGRLKLPDRVFAVRGL